MTAKKTAAAELGMGTRAIHAGQAPDPSTGAIMTPIYATSTYVQKSPGKHQGFEYSRSQNPTRMAYERCVADLEGGVAGFAFASGLAAASTVLDLLDSGSHVIAMDDLYGGTYRLFEKVRRRSAGLDFSFVDLNDTKALKAALTPETKMIWAETPTNPMLKLVDLKKVAAFAQKHGLILVVDNTFCSPMVQRPLEYGADLVLHSATKYLNGHSDIVGGIVVAGSEELAEQMGFLQNSVGAIAGPFDAFLAMRGLKTLHLRMRQHCASALELAKWLEKHPQVERVIYPGLKSHPQHALARAPDGRLRRHRQHRGQGWPAQGAPRARTLPPVRPGRIAGRRGKPDRASGDHDPRLGAARQPQAPGHQRHADPAVGGRGRCGRLAQ